MNDVQHYDPLTGRETPAWLSKAVDELIYKVRKKDIWEIVEFCIAIWAKKHPVEHKKFLEEMKEFRKQRANKFASSKTKAHRGLVELPAEINFLLDKIAPHRIAEYGPKKFWREFARRYPAFSHGEAI